MQKQEKIQDGRKFGEFGDCELKESGNSLNSRSWRNEIQRGRA